MWRFIIERHIDNENNDIHNDTLTYTVVYTVLLNIC